jgi:hypothetical protein
MNGEAIKSSENAMSSMFTWVDFAEDDRRKMADVIALFAEKDTRDELGLGGVRDTFADLLFPATSTIQTRARYFLFIPWIYQELQRRRTLPADIQRHARRDEIRLIHALENGGETDGIIGTLAQDKLARLPSSISNAVGHHKGTVRGEQRVGASKRHDHPRHTVQLPADKVAVHERLQGRNLGSRDVLFVVGERRKVRAQHLFRLRRNPVHGLRVPM